MRGIGHTPHTVGTRLILAGSAIETDAEWTVTAAVIPAIP